LTTTELTDLGDAIVANQSDIEPSVKFGDGIVSENGIIKGFHISEDEAWRLVPEFTRDRDFPFFCTTAEYVIDCVRQYAAIKAGNSPDSPSFEVWDKIAKGLHESTLLQRILSGQEVFTVPPPRSYKAPWYDLIEQGETIVHKTRFSSAVNPAYVTTGSFKMFKNDKYAVLNEHIWDIVEKISEDDDNPVVRVRYNEHAPDFLLRKATVEELERHLHSRETKEKDYYEYIIIRLAGEVTDDSTED
jgi:hypothetical protein